MKSIMMAAILGVVLATTGAISASASHDGNGGFPNESLRILTEQGS